jgi:hypothetical protein
MQQLEPRLLHHSHPYDTSTTKVRERPDAADGQQQFPMPSRDACHCRLDLIDPFGGLVAEEFERQMEPRLVHPGKLGRAITQRRAAATISRRPQPGSGTEEPHREAVPR